MISLKNIELQILFDPKIMARFQMKNTLKYITRLMFQLNVFNEFNLIHFNEPKNSKIFVFLNFDRKIPYQVIRMMNIVSKYILKLRIKHKQLEHVRCKARNVGRCNFGNNYNSNRSTKHCNLITQIDLRNHHSIIFAFKIFYSKFFTSSNFQVSIHSLKFNQFKKTNTTTIFFVKNFTPTCTYRKSIASSFHILLLEKIDHHKLHTWITHVCKYVRLNVSSSSSFHRTCSKTSHRIISQGGYKRL